LQSVAGVPTVRHSRLLHSVCDIALTEHSTLFSCLKQLSGVPKTCEQVTRHVYGFGRFNSRSVIIFGENNKEDILFTMTVFMLFIVIVNNVKYINKTLETMKFINKAYAF
jgi:hypothetical protein